MYLYLKQIFSAVAAMGFIDGVDGRKRTGAGLRFRGSGSRRLSGAGVGNPIEVPTFALVEGGASGDMVTVTAGNLQDGKYRLSIRSPLDCETPIFGITWDDSSTVMSVDHIEGDITKTVTIDFAKAAKNGVDSDEDNTDDIAQIKFCVMVDKIETQSSLDLVVASKAGVATLNYNMAGLGYQIDRVPILAVSGSADYDAGGGNSGDSDLSPSISSSDNDAGIEGGVGGVGGSIERILHDSIEPTFSLVDGGASGDMVTVTMDNLHEGNYRLSIRSAVDCKTPISGITWNSSSTVASAETDDVSEEAINIFDIHEDNNDEAPIDFPSEMPIDAPSESNPPTFFTDPPTESRSPSAIPSSMPTSSSAPSVETSEEPSSMPSFSSAPSVEASEDPSSKPSSSSAPSFEASEDPSSKPSSSSAPSFEASEDPSSKPSSSSAPSVEATVNPSSTRSFSPQIEASEDPSSSPTSAPSVEASEEVSGDPSSMPSSTPSAAPSELPSAKSSDVV